MKCLSIKSRYLSINNLIWTWHFLHPFITQNKELHESKGEKPCIPALPNRGSKLGHFYNDTFKFSVCLPTKTGSTNWLKALVALVKVSYKLNRFHMKQLLEFLARHFWITVKPVSLSPVSLSFLKNLAKLLFFSLFSVTLLIVYFFKINFSYHFLGRNTVKNPIKRPWIMRQINRKNKRALYLLIISQE